MLLINHPLIPATFLARLNRFVAQVEVDGASALAHVPTSSRMRELLFPGVHVLLAEQTRPERVTGYDLVMAYHGNELVSVDSRVPNRLLEVELRAGTLAEFAGWEFVRREVVLGESRLDFVLAGGGRRCWVEAKSVTLVEDGVALFPDAPTERGARHLAELARVVETADRAAAVFIIQRNDAAEFSPHRALDPVFARALEDAMRRGVDVFAYTSSIQSDGIAIARRVPVVV